MKDIVLYIAILWSTDDEKREEKNCINRLYATVFTVYMWEQRLKRKSVEGNRNHLIHYKGFENKAHNINGTVMCIIRTRNDDRNENWNGIRKV